MFFYFKYCVNTTMAMSIDTRVDNFADFLTEVHDACGSEPQKKPSLRRGVATSPESSSRQGGELSMRQKRIKWLKCILKKNRKHHDILSEMVLYLNIEYLRGETTTITKLNNTLDDVQRSMLNDLIVLSKTGTPIGNAWNQSMNIMKLFYVGERTANSPVQNSPTASLSGNVMELNELETEAEPNSELEPRRLFMGGRKSRRRKRTKSNKKRKRKSIRKTKRKNHKKPKKTRRRKR